MEPSPEVDDIAYRVIGAAIEVHRYLGPGYLESIYEEALGVELERRKIDFSRQHAFNLSYKGKPIGQGKLDFLVEGQLVVELKAVESLHDAHKAQVLSYLRALGLQLGLLLNFNAATLNQGTCRILNPS